MHWFVRTRWCTRSSRMTIAYLFSNRKVKVKINKRIEFKQRSIPFSIELKPRDFPHSTLILMPQADAIVIHWSIFGIFDCIAHQDRSKTEGATWRHHTVSNSTRVFCQTTMKPWFESLQKLRKLIMAISVDDRFFPSREWVARIESTNSIAFNVAIPADASE